MSGINQGRLASYYYFGSQYLSTAGVPSPHPLAQPRCCVLCGIETTLFSLIAALCCVGSASLGNLASLVNAMPLTPLTACHSISQHLIVPMMVVPVISPLCVSGSHFLQL